MAELTRIDDGHWALAGDLDFSSVNALLPAFRPTATSRLDLTEVGQSDSAGLALLIEWADRARKAGFGLALDQVNEDLRHLIQFCKVEPLFDEICAA